VTVIANSSTKKNEDVNFIKIIGNWFGVYFDVAPGAPAFSLDTPGEFPY
jgi:hypothetical protein